MFDSVRSVRQSRKFDYGYVLSALRNLFGVFASSVALLYHQAVVSVVDPPRAGPKIRHPVCGDLLACPVHQSGFLTSTIPSTLSFGIFAGFYIDHSLANVGKFAFSSFLALSPISHFIDMSDSHSSDDGHSRGAEIIAIGIVFTTLSAILVSLRFFTRFVIIRSPGWDDFLIFCSMATSIALTALTAKRTKNLSRRSLRRSIS